MVHGILGLCSVDLRSPSLCTLIYRYIYIYIEVFRSRDSDLSLFPSEKRFYSEEEKKGKWKDEPVVQPASNNIGKITFNDYPRYHEKFNKGKGRKFLVTR